MRVVAVVVTFYSLFFGVTKASFPGLSRTGACYYGLFGQAIDCGGGYVVPGPSPVEPEVSPTTQPSAVVAPVTTTTPTTIDPGYLACIEALAVGGVLPNHLCTPTPTPTAAAPAPAAPPDPVTLAVQFWQTIPLPVPKPTIPPGYAVTGKVAYLVTNGTTAPPAYQEQTPLGQLSIQATGSYLVDWGEGPGASWTGPYTSEGQPWPDGNITHTYDNVGVYTVTIREQWTAVWRLAGATGVLGGLATEATIPGFRAEQLQAVITG